MVVVCGEALMDVIRDQGGAQRAAPGGGPFNTARALARLGVRAAFLGRLSTDEFGRRLEAALRGDGVSLGLAAFGPEPTTIAVADVDSAGHATYRFEVEGTSAPNLTADMIPEHLSADVRALHVGSLGLTLQPIAASLAALAAREHRKRLVMLDPNVRPGLGPDAEYRARLHDVIEVSTIVKASEADVAWLFPGVGIEHAARSILDRGPVAVVVTLGAEGAVAVHRGLLVTVTAPHVEVVDTIGAGDAFGAALLAWLLEHDQLRPDLALDREQLHAALEFACLAAAITCTRAGADPPSRSELERWM